MIAVGLFAAIYAQRYDAGTLQRMGPGFFPIALGIILAALGLIIMIPAFFRKGEKIAPNWRCIGWVTLSVVVFGALLNSLGLIITTAIMTFISSIPGVGMTMKSRVVLSICIAAITYLIFSFGLGMIIPVWPWSY